MAEHADTPDPALSDSTAPASKPTPNGVVDDAPDRSDDPGGVVAESQDSDAETTSSTQESTADSADEDEVEHPDESGQAAGTGRSRSGLRLALVFGIAAILAIGAAAGWSGYRGFQEYQARKQRELFLQVGRQGALNLTTISYTEIDADVQRILDSATGTFYDDFKKRSQPFVEIVKQAQSKSVGTITEAGLESVDGDQARVLVAVHVTTSNVGATDQPPRAWRMRIDVQKTGDGAKVSNVQFVP
jgi:Mce-associated membrane protein